MRMPFRSEGLVRRPAPSLSERFNSAITTVEAAQSALQGIYIDIYAASCELDDLARDCIEQSAYLASQSGRALSESAEALEIANRIAALIREIQGTANREENN